MNNLYDINIFNRTFKIDETEYKLLSQLYININPMVIAKKTNTESSKAFCKLAETLKSFSKDNINVSAVEYIAFEIDEDISFEKIF